MELESSSCVGPVKVGVDEELAQQMIQDDDDDDDELEMPIELGEG